MSVTGPPRVRCSRCGTENPPEAQFCMRCGSPLAQRCPVCGTENPLDAHFCLRCGAPLRGAGSVERRVVSVLFTDLVGSTPLAQALDAEPMRRLVADYFAAMREEIQWHGGTVEKFIGDAVMAVFGLPTAHEDDAERAVRAALAMQRRIPDLNARLSADLRMRIGIATGEVVADLRAVGAREFMATGEVVNLAARLQQAAPPAGIVVDGRTYALTRTAVQYEPLPPTADGDFAGLPRWQPLALAERPAVKRLHAPMVGRNDEMQFLLALYRRVVDGQRHHLVTIIGSAGVGKSRLVEEFVEGLRGTPDPPHILRGRCPAYGEGLTYWPLAEMLRQECAIKDNEPAPAVSEQLRACILEVCVPVFGRTESERIATDLAAVLGIQLPPDYAAVWQDRLQALKLAVEGRPVSTRDTRLGGRQAGDVILRAFRQFLIAKARLQPLVLIFEDLHWAEESLLELVEHLALRGVDVPILTLGLARPELLERHPDWGGRVRNYTALSLSPLPGEQGRRLIGELLHGHRLPGDVREAIIGKAEGNPFFIEEILRMLIDGGILVRDEREWRWASQPVEIRIPDTIHSILAARLDLLPALERRVTQDAAVAGRIFWLGALVATDGLSTAEAMAALERLQERELVEERAVSSLAGEREFAFKHALIREVAYTTLPKGARSEKHLRFAGWLESTAAETADKFLEVLAYHHEQAWRYRFETGDKAVDLARTAIAALRAAGARALALRTLPEARRLHDRALAVIRNAALDGETALLLEVLTSRCEVVKWLTQPEVLIEDTETILTLAPTIGRDDLLARAWLNRAFADYLRERLQPADEALARALQLFRKLGDRQGEADALEVLGRITEGLRGKLSKAQVAYRQAIEIYRELGDGQGMARTMARLGRTALNSGNLQDARPILLEALELAQRHHERISEVAGVMGLAVLAHLTGESPEAIRLHHEAIRLQQELGMQLDQAFIHRHLGMHYLRQGRLEDAEREMEAAVKIYRENAEDEPNFIFRSLAEVLLAKGDLLAAADYAERALASVEERADPITAATFGATLGRIRAAQGRADEAEALLRHSVEILESSEYRIDVALTLMRYGEALRALGQAPRAGAVLDRARDLFAQMGAAHFVGAIDRLRVGASP